MSLLITSSKQPRVGGTIDIGIEKPFNYINNFQNPVKIPKNSEIAVESVKINRQPRIQAKDKTILGWFGRRFHQTSGSSVSETSEYVIANVLPIQKDSSSPLEFADQLKDIFNDMYSYHPEFDVTQTVVSVSYTAEGAFNGYLVDMSETAATPATRIPDSVLIIDPTVMMMMPVESGLIFHKVIPYYLEQLLWKVHQIQKFYMIHQVVQLQQNPMNQ